MGASSRTKAQLIDEIELLHQRVERLEADEIGHKKAGESLHESEEKLRLMFESVNDGVVVTDPEGRIIEVNRRGREMFGAETGDEVVGKSAFALVSARDQLRAAALMQTAAESGVSGMVEFELRRADGSRYPAEMNSSVLKDASGEAAGFIAVVRDTTERKRAEEALKSERDKLQALINGIDRARIGVDIVDVDFRIQFQSDMLQQRFGDLQGKVCYEEYMGREAPCDVCPAIESMKSRAIQRTELIAADGRDYELISAPLPDEDGAVRRAVEVVLDITDRKRAEEALREREHYLVEAQAIAHLGHWKLDPETQEVSGSDEFFRIFGLGRDEATLASFAEVVHPDDREYDLYHIRRGVEHGIPWDIEHRLICRDGTEKWVHARGEATTDESGKPTLVVGTVQDITNRKQAEEALKLSEERYRQVVENATEAIVVAQDEMLKFYNNRTMDMTGYSEEDLDHKSFVELVHPEDRHMVIERHKQRLEGEDIPSDYSFRVIDKDGGIRLAEISSVLITWEGRPATLNLLRDVTERKQLEGRVVEYAELDRMKTDLLSTVSHELRSPLAAIKGYATLMLDYADQLSTEEKHRYLQSIDRSCERLAELIDHLLDMSRLDAGLLKLNLAPANIAGLLLEAVREAEMRSPHHRIELDLTTELLVVEVDEMRIRQVLDNLLDNAFKYSEKGTEVMVSARQCDTELLVRVTDQGVGVRKEELSKVFDRMYRVEHRLTKDVGGVGLGLAICKGLVEAHSGRIWLESEEGIGSTVSFAIPIKDASDVFTEGRAQ